MRKFSQGILDVIVMLKMLLADVIMLFMRQGYLLLMS